MQGKFGMLKCYIDVLFGKGSTVLAKEKQWVYLYKRKALTRHRNYLDALSSSSAYPEGTL